METLKTLNHLKSYDEKSRSQLREHVNKFGHAWVEEFVINSEEKISFFHMMNVDRKLARAQNENSESSFPKCAVPGFYLWLNCPMQSANYTLVPFVSSSGENDFKS